MNDLDLWYSYRSCTHLVDCIYQLWHRKTTIVSEISIVLPFSPYKNKMDQNWHCRIIGQGQPRVIIWTNLIWFEHPMLHTKFQGHRSFGSGKKDFLRFLSYIGMAAILVMWPALFEQTFNPLSQGGSTWNLIWIGPVVSEEKMLENVNVRRTTDDGGMPLLYPGYYKLTSEHSAQMN